LLSLGVELQQHVASGALTPGHARALLALEDRGAQQEVGERIIADGLSVRATERLIRALLEQRDAPAAQEVRPAPYVGLQDRLSDAFATKVRITGTARRGQVVIDFSGQDDLQRLLNVLEGGVGAGLAQEAPL
jgi:ParB family chromosome partitioning protein